MENPYQKPLIFLISRRSIDKLWHDFSLTPGESDEWVSGYVGSILTESGSEGVKKIVRETLNILGWRRLSGNGGWGYNSKALEDADSTVWCLRLSNNLGVGDLIRAQIAKDFVLQHVNSDGGVSTYAEKVFPTKWDVSGFCQTHKDVTAAAANLPQFNEQLCKYLAANQKEDGSWQGYWFTEETYTVAHAVEAFSKNRELNYEDHYSKALSWVLTCFNEKAFIGTEKLPQGSPLETALGLRILLLADKEGKTGEVINLVLEWLLSNQSDDGSWQSSVFMRFLPMHLADSAMYDYIDWEEGMVMDTGVITRDQNRLFTTATVLYTLNLLHDF